VPDTACGRVRGEILPRKSVTESLQHERTDDDTRLNREREREGRVKGAGIETDGRGLN